MSFTQELEMTFLTGHCFALSERTAIQTAAPLLLAKARQSSIKVWGKILGFTADYILVQAFPVNLVTPSQSFFSLDQGITYSVLDVVNEKKAKAIAQIKGAFVGDAAYEYRVPSGVDAEGAPTFVTVKESERLAWFVQEHDNVCRVAPRGAYLKQDDGSVRRNVTFQGLEVDEASFLNSYVHIRAETARGTRLEQDGVNASIDFADPLTNDIPQGLWSIKFDQLKGVIIGSTVRFPGAVFYHFPETQRFGNVYIGDGNISTDMAFIM